jgi:hypothetical protein
LGNFCKANTNLLYGPKKWVDLGDGEQKEVKLKYEILDFISLKDTYFVCTSKKQQTHGKKSMKKSS